MKTLNSYMNITLWIHMLWIHQKFHIWIQRLWIHRIRFIYEFITGLWIHRKNYEFIVVKVPDEIQGSGRAASSKVARARERVHPLAWWACANPLPSRGRPWWAGVGSRRRRRGGVSVNRTPPPPGPTLASTERPVRSWWFIQLHWGWEVVVAPHFWF